MLNSLRRFTTPVSRKTLTRKKGISATGYGLLVGLIGVVSIAAVSSTGSNVNHLLDNVAEALGGSAPPAQPTGVVDLGGPLISLGEGVFDVIAIAGTSPGDCSTLTLSNIGDEAGGGGWSFWMSGASPALFGECQDVSGTPCGDGPLAAGASCSLGVNLLATEDGTYTGVFNVASFEGSTASRELSGVASGLAGAITMPSEVLAVFPIFDGISPGDCTPLPVTNSGTAPLESLSLSFTGSNPANFEQCSENLPSLCPQDLAPGVTCDLGVRLTASIDGPYSASVTVTDGVASASRSLSSTANGFVPRLSFDPGPIAVASLSGATSSGCVPLTVTNTGRASGGGTYTLSVTGADGGSFAACTDGLSTPCSGALPVGNTCQMGVQFTSVRSGEHLAVARLASDGGLTATVNLTATSDGAGTTCAHVGEGWCKSYTYPWGNVSLLDGINQCANDSTCLGVSTYRACVQTPGSPCGNNRVARCADLDFSRWPSNYATFQCPNAAFSLGDGTFAISATDAGNGVCVNVPVENIGLVSGGSTYALSFSGGQASQFSACTPASDACSGSLAAGDSCNLGVRVALGTGQTPPRTTLRLTVDGIPNVDTRPVETSIAGLAAQLDFTASSFAIGSVSGSTLQTACRPITVRNFGTLAGGGGFQFSLSGDDDVYFDRCSDGLSNPCSGALAPGQSCTTGVRFSSYSNGSYSARLTMTTAGGLSATTDVDGTASGINLSCPYLNEGWCDSYSTRMQTTLVDALSQCENDATCLGVTTYQSCLDNPGQSCSSGYYRCRNLNFTRWPTNYATFACGKPWITATDEMDAQAANGSSGGGCTAIAITNSGGGDASGFSVSLGSGDSGQFESCSSGISNLCGSALANQSSCNVGVKLTSAAPNGTYWTYLTVSGGNLPASARVTVNGTVTNRQPVMNIGSGTFTVASVNGANTGACTTLSVTNSSTIDHSGGAITASTNGGDASVFASCTDGISNLCGSTLSAGASCNLGMRISTSSNGTFTSTVTVSASGATSGSRAIQGTGTNVPSTTCVLHATNPSGWCDSYQYISLPNGGGDYMTRNQAFAICLADSNCVGITTWQACDNFGPDEVCNRQFARCLGPTMTFPRWPSGYRQYDCSGT